MDAFIGGIIIFGGDYNPRDWAMCQGQMMDINQNPTLYAVIGTNYGGDGRTNMGIPDLRGRLARGFGQGVGTSYTQLGQMGGYETINKAPSHTHKLKLSTDGTTTENATTSSTIGASGNISGTGSRAQPVSIFKDGATSSIEIGATSENTGGSSQVSVLNPFLSMNYIIALQGVFPSRN